MSKRGNLILGAVFFAVMISFAAANAYQTSRHRMSNPGWNVTFENGRTLVDVVFPSGPAAQLLQKGDEILAYNGRPVTSVRFLNDLPRSDPGTAYRLTIKRGEEVREVPLVTTTFPPSIQLFFLLLTDAVPAIFLLTGLAVFVLKPDDKQALVLSLMFGSFVLPFFETMEGLPPLLAAVMIAGAVLYNFFWPLFFHFFLIFPERSPLLRRFPRLEYFLYLPTLLIFVPYMLTAYFLMAVDPDKALALQQKIPYLVVLTILHCVGYLFAGFVSLLINYRQARVQSRRKMRVVVAGAMAGFFPFFVFIALLMSGAMPRVDSFLFRWMAVIAVGAFALFPLSFAYAIIRHQVIPIRVIIRRGIRYVLVSRGSVFLETLAVLVAVGLCLKGLFAYFGTPNPAAIGAVTAVVSILVWNISTRLHHRIVAPAIDRRFFRRAYNAQQIFSELGNALRSMTDVDEATSLVSAKIQDALQTANVTIFLRQPVTGDYVCSICSERLENGETTLAARHELVFARDSEVIARLRESPSPLTVDFDDPASWTHALMRAVGRWRARRDFETLRIIKAALLLPIATKEQLHGMISLGPRLGDLPFSRSDRLLLSSLAWQLAFAIENAQLVERKVEEERLRRELAMATEVQQRLFPARPPIVKGLDLSGVCHPAQGVGGDYYDFLRLGGGKVGIAVADVAGKGMSAALVMSIVQASLRSQAETTDGSLTELIASMNRLLLRSTGTNSYATFFYAQYEEETRRLTYVNAGHNPPLLFHAGSRARVNLTAAVGAGREGRELLVPSGEMRRPFETLTTGGTVIGLFEECAYEQQTIPMLAGDVLVAYTDGVTEALDPRGEEFGERRLQDAVARHATLSAQEIRDLIVADLYEWTQDAPQHDDITLVILKVV